MVPFIRRCLYPMLHRLVAYPRQQMIQWKRLSPLAVSKYLDSALTQGYEPFITVEKNISNAHASFYGHVRTGVVLVTN